MKPGQAYFYSGPRKAKWQMPRWMMLSIALLICVLFMSLTSNSQQQQSGGVIISGALPVGGNIIGKVGIDQTTPGTTNLVSIGSNGTVGLVAGSAVIGHVINDAGSAVIGHTINDSGSTTAVTALPALPTGTNNLGYIRALPSPCTQSTNFTNTTVGVATSAGTSVTSTTTCVSSIYVNNITNSAATLRVQDKTGTPIIFIGGAGDYSIPANSNVMFPLGGVTFTGGLTAIAGTGSALNLVVNGVQ